MSPRTTDPVVRPTPRVVRVPRGLPPAPRALQRTLGRAPRSAGLVFALALVAAFVWLYLLLQDADRDVAAQGQAIGGLAGDVTALRSAVAGLGGNPDEVAPEPSARLDAAGVSGPAGAQGPPGPVGASGASGASGAAGASGASGADGRPGVAGSNGSPGASGAAGGAGPSGAAGASGPAGAGGVDGAPGAAGTPGAAGAEGTPGGAGPAGAQGEPGPAGASGAEGPVGPAGAPGADGRAITAVDCTGTGDSSTWVLTYSDGTTSSVAGPCRLAPGTDTPTGEPTTTPPIETTTDPGDPGDPLDPGDPQP